MVIGSWDRDNGLYETTFAHPFTFPTPRAKPLIGRDVRGVTAGFEQAQRALVEIHVQIRRPAVDLIVRLEIRLVGLDALLAHVGRVADHRVETAVGQRLAVGREEDFGEG